MLLLSAPALSQGEQLELTWNAPSACPSESDVKTAVMSGAAAQGVESKSRPTLFARAHVSEEAGEGARSMWRVLLETERGGVRGQREIEAESCAALAEATAVVLSLALLELADEAPSEPPEAAPPSGETPSGSSLSRPVAVPVRPSEKKLPPPAARRFSQAEQGLSAGRLPKPKPSPKKRPSLARFALSARGGFNAGTLPRLAPGGALGAAWLPGAFRFEIGAQMWAKQSELIPDTPAGADLLLRSLGARACLEAWSSRRFALSPCIGSEYHLMKAQGFGSDSNYDATARWAAFSAGALGVAQLTRRVALRADVEGRVPLARPRFFVERVGTVHEVPGFAVTALFGAEVHFP